MSIGVRQFSTNDRFAGPHNVEHYLSGGTVGNVTSAPASTNILVPRAGTITAAALSCTMGADVSNALSISVQVTNTRTGSAIFTTVPSIAKSAGNVFASTSNGASTGVVLVVLDTTKLAVLAGDVLKAVWTLTRTASPGTEIADASFRLIVSENQDFDPASA